MHAHPDGLGIAVADNPQSAAPAAGADVFHDLEVNRCATRLRLLVATGFAMTLISASLAFDWWDSLGSYDKAMGYAGVAVFGPITAWLVWMLPGERGPVVVVTPYGIRDRRFGNEFLLWDSIADVSAEERGGQRVIVLTPTPGLQRQLSCIHAASRDAQTDRIVIQSEGLATDFDTLLRACRDCHSADSRTALRRERADDASKLAPQVS